MGIATKYAASPATTSEIVYEVTNHCDSPGIASDVKSTVDVSLVSVETVRTSSRTLFHPVVNVASYCIVVARPAEPGAHCFSTVHVWSWGPHGATDRTVAHSCVPSLCYSSTRMTNWCSSGPYAHSHDGIQRKKPNSALVDLISLSTLM